MKVDRFFEWFEHPPEEPEFEIASVLPRLPRIIVSGAPKAGKSQLTWEIAWSLFSGDSLLGDKKFWSESGRKVLVLNQENHPRDIYNYLQARAERSGLMNWTDDGATWAVPKTEFGSLEFVNTSERRLTWMEDRGDLADYVVDRKIDWLVLDPAYVLWPGLQFNEGDKVGGITHALDEFIVETGTKLILVHHATKNVSKGGDVWRGMLGSTIWQAWVDGFVGVSGEGGFRTIKTEGRVGGGETIYTSFDKRTLAWEVLPQELATNSSGNFDPRKMKAEIRAREIRAWIPIHPDLDDSALAEKLQTEHPDNELFTSIKKDTLRKQVARLRKEMS